MVTATLQLSDQDRAALQTLLDESAEAARRNDWEGWLSVFTDEAILLPPDVPIVEGKAACRAYLAEFPEVLDFETIMVEAKGYETFALVRGTFFMRVEVEGAAVDTRGKWMLAAERQGDGSFLFGWDMWNLDAPIG